MLPDIKIASPCAASWESMTGDDRSRHCSACDRHVYNFAAMTTAEIEQLIAAGNGERLCGRLYRRADGTVLTSDCPVGLRMRIRRVSRRLSTALAAAISLAFTVKALPQDDSMMGDIAVAQSGVSLSVVHQEVPVVRAQIKIIDLKSNRQVATGESDAAGRFSLALTPGYYRVLVEKIGLVSHDVAVSIQPHQMRPVTVNLPDRSFLMGIVALPAKKVDAVAGQATAGGKIAPQLVHPWGLAR